MGICRKSARTRRGQAREWCSSAESSALLIRNGRASILTRSSALPQIRRMVASRSIARGGAATRARCGRRERERTKLESRRLLCGSKVALCSRRVSPSDVSSERMIDYDACRSFGAVEAEMRILRDQTQFWLQLVDASDQALECITSHPRYTPRPPRQTHATVPSIPPPTHRDPILSSLSKWHRSTLLVAAPADRHSTAPSLRRGTS